MECPHLPELGYGEFSRRLHEKAAGRRLPLVGSLELTFRCNLHCVHCYLAHGHSGLPGQQELTVGEIGAILDAAVDEGCLWLLLTGGEPLLRPDFADIYVRAKRRGLIVSLFTNGTLLTPRIADLLAEWRPFVVEITLYGRTQETYERITGVPGSHARCLRGIELLLERGIHLNLKTMVMTLNQQELGEMEAYAESLGVEFRFDTLLNAGLDGSLAPTRFRLAPEEVVALDIADAKRMESWHKFCDRFIGAPLDVEHLYICSAGLDSFHIDPYGWLSACMIAREPHYDLRAGSFHRGWTEWMGRLRERKRTRDVACAHCPLISLCGQCPGWAQLEHGDPEEPVDYLCQVAHLRARAFGVEAPNRFK